LLSISGCYPLIIGGKVHIGALLDVIILIRDVKLFGLIITAKHSAMFAFIIKRVTNCLGALMGKLPPLTTEALAQKVYSAFHPSGIGK